MGCCWGVSRLVGESWWAGVLLLYAPPILYLVPCLLLLGVVALGRQPAATARGRLALALTGVALLDLNVPPPHQVLLPGRFALRVLVYNVAGGDGGLRSLREPVQRFRPDLLIFTEAFPRSRFDLQERALGDLLPGWRMVRGGDVLLGTRWPVTAEERVALGTRINVHDPTVHRELVRATVQAPFGAFHLVGVHFKKDDGERVLWQERLLLPYDLEYTASVRMDQARTTAAYLDRLRGPVLLGGDLNTPPGGRSYGLLRRRLEDSFSAAGWGFGHTFPAGTPFYRLDYLFHSRHFATRWCRVGAPAGSDHRPLEVGLIRS